MSVVNVLLALNKLKKSASRGFKGLSSMIGNNQLKDLLKTKSGKTLYQTIVKAANSRKIDTDLISKELRKKLLDSKTIDSDISYYKRKLNEKIQRINANYNKLTGKKINFTNKLSKMLDNITMMYSLDTENADIANSYISKIEKVIDMVIYFVLSLFSTVIETIISLLANITAKINDIDGKYSIDKSNNLFSTIKKTVKGLIVSFASKVGKPGELLKRDNKNLYIGLTMIIRLMQLLFDSMLSLIIKAGEKVLLVLDNFRIIFLTIPAFIVVSFIILVPVCIFYGVILRKPEVCKQTYNYLINEVLSKLNATSTRINTILTKKNFKDLIAGG